jgi:YD repeat-containing protein
MVYSGRHRTEIKKTAGFLKPHSLIALFLLAIIFVLSGCSKSNSSTANSASYPKTYTEDVRSSVIGNSVTTFNLSYDNQGRLLSMISTSTPTLKLTYQYSGNSFTSDMYNNDVLQIHEMYWLNAASLVDSTFQFNNTQDTTTEKYNYDANKELTQKIEYEYHQAGSIPGTITSYIYDNAGNLATESTNTGNSTQYTYYTNLANVNFFASYFPQPKNLIKTATLSLGGFLETATHYYSFDNSNRLTQDSTYTTATNVTVVKTYTY